MPLITYYTTASGPGYTASQAVPAKSLGGFVSKTLWGGGVQGDLFGIASAANVQDARADFRAVYVHNHSETDTHAGVRVYATPGTDGAAGISLGADPMPSSYLDALSQQGVDVSTIYSPPAGVVFSAPSDYAGGADLGDLPPTAGHMLWIRRVPLGSSGSPSDYTDLTIEDANGYSIIRRIYWETSPYADTTRQDSPVPNADPTPSPFRLVQVDYLTAGGSRITWVLDRSIADNGPYVFQLQYSRSGIASESDWSDVGPPVQDALYLLDPSQRLWGAPLSNANYRIILTTGDNHYTSDPTPAIGTLDIRGWAEVGEVLRKERMMLRQFVGEDGFLLKAKRYGTLCSCTDPDSREVNNSSCPICYGTKFVGGYYAPIPMTYANTTNASIYEMVKYNEGVGTTRPNRIFGRVLGDALIESRDVWVSKGEDRRYYVHNVDTIAQLRGVDILKRIELREAPRSDVIHTIKLVRPEVPKEDWQKLEIVDV